MAEKETHDVLVLYRDWRKRIFHNVTILGNLTDCFKIEFQDEISAMIPKDAVSYIGPPGPWDNGGVY